MICGKKTEVYSRVCGFYRPIQQWNVGKQSEFFDRVEYIIDIKKDLKENEDGVE